MFNQDEKSFVKAELTKFSDFLSTPDQTQCKLVWDGSKVGELEQVTDDATEKSDKKYQVNLSEELFANESSCESTVTEEYFLRTREVKH